MTDARTLTDADVEAVAEAVALRLRRRAAPVPPKPAPALDEVGARRVTKAREAAASELRRRGHGRSR